MPHHPHAAPAILGDKLLAIAKAHEQVKPLPLSSGSAVIDEKALDGGFRFGEITSIAGESRTGETLITYHAIASHLLADESNEVAVIDTTGSFSPLRLRDVLVFRLEARRQRDTYQQSGYMYEKHVSASRNNDEQVDHAMLLLDRVKMMRVFDFAGMVEAVSEVRKMREELSRGAKPSEADRDKRKTEVHDSEEELDEDDAVPANTVSNSEQKDTGTVGMVIVDTITNVVSSVMSKSQVQGQALLASFMRSLHHLTVHHHICTILINAAVGLNTTRNPRYQRRVEESASIFSSTLGKPALGKSFTYMVDTSILMSIVPKSSTDAVVAFSDSPILSFGKAVIMEILKDRCGAREGRWAAFEINAGVKFVPLPG